MKLLTGAAPRDLDHDEVRDAYPWPEGRWVRAMMVTTLDGAAAGPDGLSGSISGDADRAVFDAVRRLADVVLVGAETVRAENYQPMQANEADAQARKRSGQLAAPVLVILSVSLDLDWDSPRFSDSTHTPIVITAEGGPGSDRIDIARTHADVIALPGERVDIGSALEALAARGLRRVVCEGGPQLLGQVVDADLLDEADITVSPMFVGQGQQPVTPTIAPHRLKLHSVMSEDDFVMLRYVRTGSR